MSTDENWAAAAAARMAALSALGELGDHYAPVINPAFMGGPEWPSRPGYQAVRLTDGGSLLCTNGLSDAWEREPDGVGLGLEVYAGTSQSVDDPQKSWLMAAVHQLGNVCAGHGGLAGLLLELGALTVELENNNFPAAYVLENGRVCVLLGTAGPLETVALPNGPVRFVCATLISPTDYADVMALGDSQRAKLASETPWKLDAR